MYWSYVGVLFAFVKRTPLSPDHVVRIREALLREFESNSRDNGYLLNQISRRYEDGVTADVAAVGPPDRIADADHVVG